MYHNFFIHLLVNRYLGCFHVLAIVNSAAMNIGAHVSFWIIVFSRHIPSSGIAGLYGSIIASFKRNFHTILHSGCINLHFHQVCKRVLFCPHSFQNLLFVDFLMMAVLTGMRWYLIVVFIYTSLIISDVEHLFIFFITIYMSYLEKCLPPIFWIGLFGFLILSFMNYLCILEINPLLVPSFTNIFSHSEGCLFVLFMVSLAI